jgi:hypothetical protein
LYVERRILSGAIDKERKAVGDTSDYPECSKSNVVSQSQYDSKRYF